jgi:hypothetical protein
MKFFGAAQKKTSFTKLMRVMKLTIILLFFFVFNASASGFGQQKITLKNTNADIATILTQIEKQTNYRFLYNNNLPELKKQVSLDVENTDLKDVLDEVLKGTTLSYQFMENNLVVIKDMSSQLNDVKAVVTGRVTGENGTALPGVSVQIKGTTKGTITNAEGQYSISTSDNDVLVFSYVGYTSQEVPVSGRTEINVTLATANAELTQVVVIGYGTQKKKRSYRFDRCRKRGCSFENAFYKSCCFFAGKGCGFDNCEFRAGRFITHRKNTRCEFNKQRRSIVCGRWDSSDQYRLFEPG